MPNPDCLVNGSPTPQNVAASATVTGGLADPSGADFWSLTCVSTDEQNTAAAINATLTLNQTAKTFSFTAPSGLGSALLFKSTVGVRDLGQDANGTAQPAYSTTFKVNVLTSGGNEVLAFDEEMEQSAVFGWIGVVNAMIRSGGGGGGGGASNVFVYREGGTTAGNVYATFALALAARSAVQGPADIFFDNSLGSPVLPVASYAIPDATRFIGSLNGNSFAAPVQVQCADGVTFSTPPTDFENVQIHWNNTSVPGFSTSDVVAITLRNAWLVADANTQPMYAATGFAEIEFFARDQSQIATFGGGPLIDATGGGVEITVALTSQCTMSNNIISGGSGALLSVDYDDSCDVSAAQSSFTGTFIPTLISAAFSVDYSPTTPGNWASIPADVARALDLLAARSSIEGAAADSGGSMSAAAGTGPVFLGPVGITPIGTRLLITVMCSGNASLGLTQVQAILEYSVDGGASYNSFIGSQALFAGIPLNGVTGSFGVDTSVGYTALLAGLTPGVAVLVQLLVAPIGSSGTFAAASSANFNVLNVIDLG